MSLAHIGNSEISAWRLGSTDKLKLTALARRYMAKHNRASAPLAGLILAGVMLLGADWQTCQSDLDRLRARASEASENASRTRNASLSMDSKKRELDECREAKRDGCQALSTESDGARKRFLAAKRALDAGLDDIDTAVQDANRSCDYPVSSTGTSATSDPVCWLLQPSKGHVSAERLKEMCKRVGKSEEQCRICLQ